MVHPVCLDSALYKLLAFLWNQKEQENIQVETSLLVWRQVSSRPLFSYQYKSGMNLHKSL